MQLLYLRPSLDLFLPSNIIGDTNEVVRRYSERTWSVGQKGLCMGRCAHLQSSLGLELGDIDADVFTLISDVAVSVAVSLR